MGSELERLNREERTFLEGALNFIINTPSFKNIEEGYSFNDEPKIFSFYIRWKLNRKCKSCNNDKKYDSAGGCSFSRKKAFLKTIGETVERYFLGVYSSKNLIWDCYNHLKETNKNPVNPRDFFSFSNIEDKPEFYKDDYSKINWIKGRSLTYNRDVLVPAQLVFVPYCYKKNEPVIRFPISTGAASYSSLKGAILNGILEVVERDAFMISYLNKLPRNIISVEKNEDSDLRKIIFSIQRYNLDLYILDISTDVPVYTILSIIIDKTGIGPAVSLGLKSSLRLKDAIVGSIEECIHGRLWVREMMMNTDRSEIERIRKDKYRISRIRERGILWSGVDMIKKINFFFCGNSIRLKEMRSSKARNLKWLLSWFRKRNIELIYVDITPPSLKNQSIYIVKVLIPSFQPLYLDERFPFQNKERLEKVPSLLGFKPLRRINKFPHPFL